MAETTEKFQDKSSRRSVFRRYRWVLFLLLAVVFLPSLLTVTGKQDAVLRLVQPKLGNALHFESASTHWWAPVALNNVELTDIAAPTAEDVDPVPLLTAGSVKTTQPLWKLAMSMGSGAEVTIVQPVLNVRVRDGETNVEATLQHLFGGEESSDGPGTPVSVTVQDGIVRLLSETPAGTHPSPLFTTISNINGTFSTLDQSKTVPNITMVADIGNVVSLAAGQTNAQRATPRQRGVNPRIAATLDELAADFPLVPFSDAEMAVLESDDAQPSLKMQISAAPDRPDVQNLILEARRLKLADLEPLIQRVLPGTVCVGDISCRLQAHLLNDKSDHGFAGRLQLLGENVRWRNTAWTDGESLELESVSAQGAVAFADDGLMVNDLRIRSALLDVTGNGEVNLKQAAPLDTAGAAEVASATPAAGEVNLTGRLDFARLMKMLPETLAVADGVTAESGELRFSWRVRQQSPSESAASDVFSDQPNGFSWRLAAETSPLQATRNGQRLTLDSSLRLDAVGDLSTRGSDVIRARLAGNFGEITADPIEDGFDVTGQINPDRLWQDVRQLIDIPRPGIASDVTVEGQVRLRDAATHLSAISLKSSEININSPSLTIYHDAPVVQMFDGSVTIDGMSPALKTLLAPWYAATWLSDNSTVVAKLGADPKQNLSVQAVVRPNQQTGRRTSTSDASFLIDEGRIDAKLVTDTQTGHYRVERGQIEIPGLTSDVTGILSLIDGLLIVNLDADTQYDLDEFTQRLLADPNRRIQLTGIKRDIFHVEGSPSIWTEADLARLHPTPGREPHPTVTPLQASGQISWDGGRLYGLKLGPGAAVAQLQNGMLRTEPISCQLGTGTVKVMPQWDMNMNLVQLAPGSRVEDLQVTPDLSREWLGYIAPMLSDAANVRGAISARVQRFDYFMDTPSTSTIQGQLSLRDAVASAGQSLEPLMQVLNLVDGKSDQSGQRRQLVFPNQDIPFELRNGMVMHDGLQAQFGNYGVSSSGGVGLDKRVQLVLTVPLERNVGAAANGRTLQIPVGGTVDRPQLETRGLLQNLGRQQIQNQVDKQLDRGLKGLLDKLR